MARATKTLCSSCEAKIDAGIAFCPSCGRPTEWASHDQRVQWEVQQWRTKRAPGAVHAPPPPAPRKRPARDILPEQPSAGKKDAPKKEAKSAKKRRFGRKKAEAPLEQPPAAQTDEQSVAPVEGTVVASAGDLTVVRTSETHEMAAPTATPAPPSNGSAPVASNGSGSSGDVKQRQIAHMSVWEREAIERRERARAQEKLAGAVVEAARAPEIEAPERIEIPEPEAAPADAHGSAVVDAPATVDASASGDVAVAKDVDGAEVTAEETPAPAPAARETTAAKKKTTRKPAAKKPAAKKKTTRKAAAKKPAAKKKTAKRTAAPKKPEQAPAPAPISTLHEELLAESVKILRTIGDQMSTLNERIGTLEDKIDAQPKRRGLFRRG